MGAIGSLGDLRGEKGGACSGRACGEKDDRGHITHSAVLFQSRSHHKFIPISDISMTSEDPSHLLAASQSLPLTGSGPCLKVILFQIPVQGLELVPVQVRAL